MRFNDAKLHAELSRCMYSLQGLEPLIRPDAGQVCHSLIVVSYCIPGSAHSHAACAMSRIRSRARVVSTVSPERTALSFQSWSCSNARMNSSVTRTELFAFWYWVEWLSLPSRSMSNPASRRTLALRSSTALHQMKSSTSGWSTFRMTILAARRVFPPDLMVPAEESAPRMNDTGPLGGQDVGQLVGEGSGVLFRGEVPILPPPAGDRVDHSADELANARLALGRAQRSAEV